MKASQRMMIVLGAILALGLAACGGGAERSPDESPAGQPAGQTRTEDAEEAPEGADGDSVAAQEVGQPTEPAKVTYRMTGGEDGPEELTMSWDPPRFAMLFEDGKMVVTEEGTLFCDAAGEGCFRMGSSSQGGQMAGGMGPFFGFATALQDGEELPGTTSTGEAEIAGRTATCATYDAAEYDASLQGEGEYCFDPETGLMLRWAGTDSEGNTQTVEATEFGDPDPSDFEPTGPVQEMPQGGGG